MFITVCAEAEAAGFVTTVWLLCLRHCLESSVVLLPGFGAAPVTVMGEAEWEEVKRRRRREAGAPV